MQSPLNIGTVSVYITDNNGLKTDQTFPLSVSSTIVDIPTFGIIILDAGEGTLGQLHRRYGLEKSGEVLSRVKIVFISHMHADHHLGVHQLIKAQRKVSRTTTQAQKLCSRCIFIARRG